MIEFSFDFSLLTREFKNFWSRAWSTPFRNKFVELELITTESIIGFRFLWTTGQDHAGVDIRLALVGLCVHFNFYDNRHWDYENNQYCVNGD